MRLDLIQVLRAVAAYLVVFFHLHELERSGIEMAGGQEAGLIGGAFKNGWLGVDLFFVISGFIMVYVTHSRAPGLSTIKDFLLARVFRIYPVWWLFMGLMAAYYFFAHGAPFDAAIVERMGNNETTHIISSILLIPQLNFPILSVGWTLVHEVWFYIVFSLLLLLPRKFLWVGLLGWAIMVAAGSLAGFSSHHATDYLKLATSPLTLEFIAGAAMALAFVNGIRAYAALASGLGAAGLALILAFHPIHSPFTLEWGRVLVATLPCALLVYAAACSSERVKGPVYAVLRALGDWSFSLYLCHIMAMAAVRIILPIVANQGEAVLGLPTGSLDVFRLGTPGILDNIVFIFTALIAATCVAGLSFHLFERPVLKFLNARFRKRQPDKEKARLAETTAP
ncbi:MAG: hypothetical protein CMK09_06605 [Ponticaulis sp.]|nr:hypothetical protein [Ponticaulis sp.]|tara:strand:+ start:30039 stop:31223 length:1185 start_codon:yes stop_codon:yes gene_type:complete